MTSDFRVSGGACVCIPECSAIIREALEQDDARHGGAGSQLSEVDDVGCEPQALEANDE